MLTLYKKDKCLYCYMLEDKLNDWGVEYNIINTSDNEEARQKIKEMGFTTYPVLLYNNIDVLFSNTSSLTEIDLMNRMDEIDLNSYGERSECDFGYDHKPV